MDYKRPDYYIETKSSPIGDGGDFLYWQTTTPTVEGWYWWGGTWPNGKVACFIQYIHEGGLYREFSTYYDDEGTLVPLSQYEGLNDKKWLGPLPAPEISKE